MTRPIQSGDTVKVTAPVPMRRDNNGAPTIEDTPRTGTVFKVSGVAHDGDLIMDGPRNTCRWVRPQDVTLVSTADGTVTADTAPFSSSYSEEALLAAASLVGADITKVLRIAAVIEQARG